MSPDTRTAAGPDSAMLPQELRAKLRLAESTFYKAQAAGKFLRFELKPRIGRRLYSRKLVQLYLDREWPRVFTKQSA